jgi:hypothetical protein
MVRAVLPEEEVQKFHASNSELISITVYGEKQA